MKSTFGLILICLAAFHIIHHVDGRCFQVIQRHFQCLNRINTRNNTLNDTFYQNLSRMTFDQGMDFIRKIYLDNANNCTSDYCKCADLLNLNKLVSGGDFGMLFRNATIFAYLKTVISDFNKTFQSQQLPDREIQRMMTNSNLPTLTNFCTRFEYTSNRFNFYNTTRQCDKYNFT